MKAVRAEAIPSCRYGGPSDVAYRVHELVRPSTGSGDNQVMGADERMSVA